MVEYLYDMIRVVKGGNVNINAVITTEEGELITSDCKLVIHDKDRKTILAEVTGTYLEDTEEWQFLLSSKVTRYLEGRYWYCVKHKGNPLCFILPIYFV
jgi:hypothetical protein